MGGGAPRPGGYCVGAPAMLAPAAAAATVPRPCGVMTWEEHGAWRSLPVQKHLKVEISTRGLVHLLRGSSHAPDRSCQTSGGLRHGAPRRDPAASCPPHPRTPRHAGQRDPSDARLEHKRSEVSSGHQAEGTERVCVCVCVWSYVFRGRSLHRHGDQVLTAQQHQTQNPLLLTLRLLGVLRSEHKPPHLLPIQPPPATAHLHPLQCAPPPATAHCSGWRRAVAGGGCIGSKCGGTTVVSVVVQRAPTRYNAPPPATAHPHPLQRTPTRYSAPPPATAPPSRTVTTLRAPDLLDLPELITVTEDEVHVFVEGLEGSNEDPPVLQDAPHPEVNVLQHLAALTHRLHTHTHTHT